MRDIGKYRGQRKDNGECVKGSLVKYLYLDEELTVIIDDKFNHAQANYMPLAMRAVPVIPKTVGMYTGLTDKKKDKDLYDGDRVVIGGDVGVLVWDELELCWSLQIEIESDEYQSICRFYSYEEIDAVEYIVNEEKP